MAPLPAFLRLSRPLLLTRCSLQEIVRQIWLLWLRLRLLHLTPSDAAGSTGAVLFRQEQELAAEADAEEGVEVEEEAVEDDVVAQEGSKEQEVAAGREVVGGQEAGMVAIVAVVQAVRSALTEE